jgi:hypothetical protein
MAPSTCIPSWSQVLFVLCHGPVVHKQRKDDQGSRLLFLALGEVACGPIIVFTFSDLAPEGARD